MKTFKKTSKWSGRTAKVCVETEDISGKVVISGVGYNGNIDDNLVMNVSDESEGRLIAEVILDSNTEGPTAIAIAINKPIFSVVKESEDCFTVKFWTQDGIHCVFDVHSSKICHIFHDNLFGDIVSRNFDLIMDAANQTTIGSESPMWVGKKSG